MAASVLSGKSIEGSISAAASNTRPCCFLILWTALASAMPPDVCA
jgi:hypothetical protein